VSGKLVTTANISSATPDPNMLDTNATDTIQDVLPGLGLPGTGSNVFVWVGTALIVIITAGVLLLVQAKRKHLRE